MLNKKYLHFQADKPYLGTSTPLVIYNQLDFI